jgi:signal transduction histidine kinase
MRFVTKLELSAAGVALAIGPLLGVAVFYQARSPLQDRIVRDQVQIAARMMKEIDNTLEMAGGQINVIAADNLLRDFLASPLEKNTMAEAVADELQERAGLTGPWDAMAVFDNKGHLLFSPVKTGHIGTLTDSSRSRIAFERALRGNTYSSDKVICPDTNLPAVIFAAPIFDRNDTRKVLGAVVAHYMWAPVQEILDHADETAIVRLFDSRGAVIGKRSDDHSPPATRPLAAMNPARTPLPGFDAGYAVLSSSTRGEGPMLAVDLQQKAVPGVHNRGWTLMLEMPLELMFAPIMVLAKNIGLLVFGVLLAVAVLFAVIGRLFLRPLDELVKGVHWVEQGDLDHRVVVKSKDEFAMLADSFNTMVDKLQKARDELIQKGKLAMLGQVASSVGHELRNPLGVMSNAVYFLQSMDHESNIIRKEYLNIIHDEIDRSERIVAALMDAVRTIPPAPAAYEVPELVAQVLHRYAHPSGMSVILDIPETLPSVYVDGGQIRQVLEKLISNAADAMRESGILTISAAEAEGGNTVTITVGDNGIGMTAEQLGNLFQPLFTTKARGIGLGLVVVKNLTEANGGSLKVQSEEGRGTLCSITLPASLERGNKDD